MAVLFNVTMASPDPIRLGRFWSAALHYENVDERPDLVRLRGPRTDGAPDVLILRVDDPHPGSVHLDLCADDVDDEAARLVALGAHPVDPPVEGRIARRTANGIEWVVLADPDGNPFCIGLHPS
jgi:hypothetical protein